MASSQSPQPEPEPETEPESDPPMATPLPLLIPAPPSTTSSRRLPPPCWTPEETSALIDAYRDKWYSLSRGNLRAAHWLEVSDDLHRRCPHASLPKTPLQCRHKMEKLRKRYRSELNRAISLPHHRFSSSWVYFPKMHSMEKGPIHHHHDDDGDGDGLRNCQMNGLRIKIPGNPNPNPNPNVEKGSELGKRERREGDPGMEMVESIRMMGEGFVRMEKMKMEMMRDCETMRMDMEMRRTQMILDSQHRIVEAFARSLNDSIKRKNDGSS